jgi:hypothetical protein
MVYKETITNYSENHTKRINTQQRENAEASVAYTTKYPTML